MDNLTYPKHWSPVQTLTRLHALFAILQSIGGITNCLIRILSVYVLNVDQVGGEWVTWAFFAFILIVHDMTVRADRIGPVLNRIFTR